MSLNITGLSHNPVFISEIAYACWLSHDTVLCYGPLQHSLSANDTMLVNGLATRKPYIGTILNEEGTRNVLLLLTLEHPESVQFLREVTISDGTTEIQWQYSALQSLEDANNDFPAFCEQFSQPNLKKILFLLLNFLSGNTRSASHQRFGALCHQVRRTLERSEMPAITQTAWILPDVLYIEGELAPAQTGPLRLIVTTPQSVFSSRVESMEIQETPQGGKTYASIAFFPKGSHVHLHRGSLTLLVSNQLIPLSGAIATPNAGLALLLNRLSAYDDQTRQRVREHLNKQLVEYSAKTGKSLVAPVIRNLQYYLPAAHTSIYDVAHPFGMNVEKMFPIGNEALFISGWLRDPLELLEDVVAISDLGFRISILPHMHRHPKEGVDELYKDAPTSALRGAWGFVARIPVDKETQACLKDVATLHGFRFEIMLKGGLHYSVTPDIRIFEPFHARDMLLREVATATELSETADACVRHSAADMQALCMKNIRIKLSRVIGELPKKPQVSVVIPLYRCLNFLRAQIAHFSNDPYMHQCETIYVLDSPEQEKEVTTLLEDYSQLYKFPMRLIIMDRNAGYAAASNAGAQESRAPHLLMLNSDILPRSYGWLKEMQTYYISKKSIGVLGPKLLYEDDSIQHAGMYFEQVTTRPHIENRHYYKGYPSSYAAASESREVPAVTGACLMISKNHWNDIGGYSTDYIIGDFEDSDLCLKLTKKKLSHYYLASVELNHLERQSIVLHDTYREGAAFRYNAVLHHGRWAKTIHTLMRRYAKN